jgi:hypothetical protein
MHRNEQQPKRDMEPYDLPPGSWPTAALIICQTGHLRKLAPAIAIVSRKAQTVPPSLIIFSALGTLRNSAILQLSGYADNWSVLMRTTEGANYRNHYRDSELTKGADAIE